MLVCDKTRVTDSATCGVHAVNIRIESFTTTLSEKHTLHLTEEAAQDLVDGIKTFINEWKQYPLTQAENNTHEPQSFTKEQDPDSVTTEAPASTTREVTVYGHADSLPYPTILYVGMWNEAAQRNYNDLKSSERYSKIEVFDNQTGETVNV